MTKINDRKHHAGSNVNDIYDLGTTTLMLKPNNYYHPGQSTPYLHFQLILYLLLHF